MLPVIKDIIKKHVMSYQPKGAKSVIYTGVDGVAEELGVSYATAKKLVQDWLGETY
jgi:hypothetical protein